MIGPICYVGGKRRLAPALIRRFPPHVTYVEPFAGGAQVFFHKPPSAVEVLNDLDGEVVNFLRICQVHPDELVRCLHHVVPSRRLHALYAQQDPETLTDVQRAARFLYLQKNSFGGRRRQQNYHYCVTKAPNFNPTRLPALIRRTADRLAGVQLECLPYDEILRRYDRPTTFFYLDPPYVGRELYRFNMRDDEFTTLAERLSNIQGRFLLSLNDCAVSRSAFRAFHCHEVSVVYTASRTVPTVTELVFSNYAWPSTSLVPYTSTTAASAGRLSPSVTTSHL